MIGQRLYYSDRYHEICTEIAEEFQRLHRDVRVTVGISGTGGGFKKFTVGEIDINDASRTIKGSEEKQATANGVEYIERPEVQAFIRFYIENAPDLVSEVGYVPLPNRVYELALRRFENRVTGSAFQGETAGKSLEELLST